MVWWQCTQAVTDDGSIDAQRLMDLVIATYSVHESNYDEIERSVETLMRENHVLRGNISELSQAFDGQKKLFEIILNNLPLGL
ncbi:diguanylate cyclase, partial [Rhizobium leguminosarum]